MQPNPPILLFDNLNIGKNALYVNDLLLQDIAPECDGKEH
jgi:hypothetical protein